MLLAGEPAFMGDVHQAQVRSSQEYGSTLNPQRYHKFVRRLTGSFHERLGEVARRLTCFSGEIRDENRLTQMRLDITLKACNDFGRQPIGCHRGVVEVASQSNKH